MSRQLGVRAFLALLLVGASSLSFADTGNVTVLKVKPGEYTATADARRKVAQAFYARNSDSYDFLVVFPGFDTVLREADADGFHTVGLHTLVRNSVQGIGKPILPDESGALFHSPRQLKGYIDIGTLRPASKLTSKEDALQILAHEVAHQWSGEVGKSLGLLGDDDAHWSFFLSSNASVLYGSDWRDDENATSSEQGTFTAVESRRRYSPLDLYLMGFMAPEEVPPFQLLTPASGVPHQATDLPPVDGTTISATPATLEVKNLIALHGERKPSAAKAPRDLRAAFILLVEEGKEASAEQLEHVEKVRAAWAHQFFFLTRGRAFMQTERVDRAPTGSWVGETQGLQYLLNHKTDAHWQDHPETAVRETEAVLAALAFFDGKDGVRNAVDGAVTWLTNRTPRDGDERARRLRGLALAWRPDAEGITSLANDADPLGIRWEGGRGYAPGYGATVLDTALVGLALTETSTGGGESEPLKSTLAGIESYLLAHQNGDGGWPALERGPSRLETTALVLQFLARRPRTDSELDPISMAVKASYTYLGAHAGIDGLFRDDLDLPSTTAEVALALVAWGKLGAEDGERIIAALQAQQLADGSWEGSVYQTARVLHVLRLLQVPNLTISKVEIPGCSVSEGPTGCSVSEGAGATVEVLVRNTGFIVSDGTTVEVADSKNALFAPPRVIPPLEPGAIARVQILLDTSGHGGSNQLFVKVDPSDDLDEMREDDNLLARDFVVDPAPSGVDLFVVSGDVKASPEKVSHLPQELQVTALVGNAGLTAASGVVVSISAGGTVLNRITLGNLAARTKDVPVSIPVVIPGGPYPVELTVRIGQGSGASTDVRDNNNTATLKVEAEATVGLQVKALQLPGVELRDNVPTTKQNTTVPIAFEVSNTGTTGLSGGRVEVRVVAADGVRLLTLPADLQPISSGQTLPGTVSWVATHAGTYTLEAQAMYQGSPLGSAVTATLRVEPSNDPDLQLGTDAISTNPQPTLEGKRADIHVRVRNTGASAGQFKVELFQGSVTGPLIGSATVDGLAEGASEVLTFDFTPPTADPHVLVVRVDGDDQVKEFNENNNISALEITPRSIPDLVLTEGDIVPSNSFPQAGDAVSVTVSVYNRGEQPSLPTQVHLYRGAPRPDGSNLIGQAPLVAVQEGAREKVVIPWSTSSLSGAQTLVAIVNRDGLFKEQSTNNNRAERQVLMQTGAVALSEPYISPNGDGVKESTGIFYRLSEGHGPSKVVVTARDGTQVRKFEVPKSSAPSVSVVWDGKDEAGGVVKDGEYRLVVFASAGDGQDQIGAATVVVDTNGIQIDDVGNQALSRHSFFQDMGDLVRAMPDDSGLVYFGASESTGICGFYIQPFLGGDPELFAQLGVAGAGYCNIELFDFAVSPDGNSIAYTQHNPSTGHDELRRIYRGETTPSTLVWSYSSEYIVIDPIRFQADSQRVWYVWNPSNIVSSSRQIRSVDVREGLASVRTEVSASYTRSGETIYDKGVINGFQLSPDGRRVAVSVLHPDSMFSCMNSVDLATPTRSSLLECQYRELVRDSGWVDGGRAFFIGRFAQEFFDGGLYRNVGEQWVLHDVESGVRKELTTSPFTKTSFALSPRGDAVVSMGSGPPGGVTLGVTEPIVDGTPREFARVPGVKDVGLEWSPRGTFLHGRVSGESTYWAMHHLENLSAWIQASRPLGSSAISFRGTATDLNFDSYAIAVRPLGSTSEPVVVAQRRVPVIDGQLATWNPPGPGFYEVILTVTDKAGNSATRTTKAIWSDAASAIANLSADPVIFSPDNDNILDRLTVKYEVTSPTSDEFVVTNTRTGQQVHTFVDAPRATKGFHEFTWDGKVGNTRIDDGDYLISAARASAAFVVDTEDPVVHIAPGQQLPRVNERSILINSATTLAYPPEGRPVEIPSVQVWVASRTEEKHPEDEALEAVSETDSVAIKRDHGFNAKTGDVMWSVLPEELRGSQVRIRARDMAGNTGESPRVIVPERLFLTGIGEASTFDSGGTLIHDGRTIPRIDLLRRVQNEILVDHLGLPDPTAAINPSSFTFKPQRYAFALANTVGVPIVSYAVSYPSPVTGATVVDYTNVEMLAEDAIVWDASTLPVRAFDLQIIATDATGRVFSTKVPFVPGALVDTCMAYKGGAEVATITTSLARGIPRDEELDSGAMLEFIPYGGTTSEIRVPVALGSVVIDKNLRYTTEVPTQGLTKCLYTVSLQGKRIDKSDVEGSGILNVCGLIDLEAAAGSSQQSLSLVETFRKPVQSVEVYVTDEDTGLSRLVRTLPGFDGLAAEVPLPGLSCGERNRLRFVAKLADGTVLDSARDEQTMLDLCEERAPECTQIDINIKRRADAAVCASQSAIYDVSVQASTDVPGGWQKLEAWLITPTEKRVKPLELTRNPSGTLWTKDVPTEDADLQEGEFLVEIIGTTARGTRHRRVSTPNGSSVIVDRTPALFTLSVPASGEQFCPVASNLSNGTQGATFDFKGLLSDQWLEFAELEIRSTGSNEAMTLPLFHEPSPEWTFINGSLGKMDAAKLPPGSYTLTGFARDASGGSVCLTPRPRIFHVSDSIHLDALTVAPVLFNPGPYGTDHKETRVSYSLDAPGNVTVYAISETGNRSEILPTGEQSTRLDGGFFWDGSVKGGEVLLDGKYTLQAVAVDACGRQSVKSTQVVIDTTRPVARIDAPVAGASVGSVIQVTGQATDVNFKSYSLLFEGHDTAFSSEVSATGMLGTVSTAGLGVGEHTLVLRVEDQVGLISEAKVKVQVQPGSVIAGFSLTPDLISPIQEGKTVVATIALRQRATVELQIETNDGSLKRLYGPILMDPLPSSTKEVLPSERFDDLRLNVDRDYEVKLIATAEGSALTETAIARLAIDRTPPKLEVTAPMAGSRVPGRGDVVGLVSDPHLTKWAVTYGLSEPGVEIGSGHQARAANSTLAHFEGLPDGNQRIMLTAWDGAGNSSSFPVSFISDSTPPRIAFLYPLEGEYLSSEQLTGSKMVGGRVSGEDLSEVMLSAESGASSQEIGKLVSPVEGDVQFPWSLATEGRVTLVWTARDLAGNDAQARISVVVDNTKPDAQLTAAEVGASSIKFKGTARDTNLERYTLELASGSSTGALLFSEIASGTASVESGVLGELPVLPADGVYTARLTVLDRAGNSRQSSPFEFVVDTQPPTPPELLVSVKPGRRVELAWSESSDASGIKQYKLKRASGAGSFKEVATLSGTTLSYVDALTANGSYRYVVVAVDQNNLESAPSNEESADVNMPVVSISKPATGTVVGGRVEVMGSAYAVENFKEYRLLLGEGPAPTAFTPVLSSSRVVSSHALLGTIDLSNKTEGSSWTIQLEAEDTHGNVARTKVTVSVDNVAPNRPQWASGTPSISGSNVTLSWVRNSEEDLAGYLLFRNGAPVKPSDVSSPTGPEDYLLTSETYFDKDVPYGTPIYELQAMDRAGNLSERSEPKSVTLNARTPVAELVSPPSMARISGKVALEAKVNGFDVTQVLFEARAGSETAFTRLGVVKSPPFTLEIDSERFSSDAVEVRAVASDASGVDPAPVSAYYFRGTSPIAPVPVLRAQGSDIYVDWTDSNPADKVVGHFVTRAGMHLPGFIGVRPIAETIVAGSGNGTAAYDENQSTSWVSTAPEHRRWEMQLRDAVLVEEISASSASSASDQRASLWVKVRGLWVLLAKNHDPSTSVTLTPPLEVQAVAYDLTPASSSNTVGLTEVSLETLPFITGPRPILDPLQLSNGTREYTVTAVSPFGLTTDGKGFITTYTPSLDALASDVVPTPSVVVKGSLYPSSPLPSQATLQVFRSQTPEPLLVAEGSVGWDGRFEISTPLVPGENTLFVRARYPADNVSADSAPLKVNRQSPPTIRLTANESSTSQVDFKIAVEGDGAAFVKRYEVIRVRGSTEEKRFSLPAVPPPPGFSENGLSNGLYRYTVVALYEGGLEAATSNTLLFEVKPPASEIPEAPRLVSPTRAGSPVTVATLVNTISGLTSPDTTVELFVNGRSAGTVTPEGSASRAVSTALPLKNTPSGYYSLSNDGSAIAYRFTSTTSSGSTPAIGVEDLSTHDVKVLTLSDVQFSGTPFLSPDKTRVAITATCRIATGALCSGAIDKTVLLVGEVASNTWRKVAATSPERITAVAWSPDSARVAYSTIKENSGPVLAVGSVVEPERILASFMCAGWAASATWSGDKRVIAISSGMVSGLLEWDIDKTNPADPCDPSARRTLLSSSSIEYDMRYGTLVVSPDRTQILVQADMTGSGTKSLYLVDTEGPTPTFRKLSSSGSVSSATFSWDSTRVAYKAAGQLMIHELDTGDSDGKPVGALDSTGQLLWTPGGDLLQFTAANTEPLLPPSRLEWGVPFTFTHVTLDRGPNRLVAIARSLAGTQSPGSKPIDVFVDTTRLPDLSIRAAVQPAIPRVGESAQAAVTVTNGGGSPVSGVKVTVSVLGSDGSIRSSRPVTLSGTLAPGATSAAFVPIDISGLSGGQELLAVVDPEQLIQESNRGNNQERVPFVIAGDSGISMGVHLSRRTLQADDTTTATVSVVNTGAATSVAVEVALEDDKGTRVRTLGADELFSPLGADGRESFDRSADALGLLAGTYKIVATARVAGSVVSTAHALLEILPDQGASLALSPSRSKYISGEPVDLMARVVNLSSNALLSGAVIALEVKNAEGFVLETLSLDLRQALTPGASASQVVLLATRPVPGTYSATARLQLDGSVLATSETSFVVEGRVDVQGAVAVVDAAGSPPVVPSGKEASIQLRVKNDGTVPAESLVVFVHVVDEGSVSSAPVKTERVPVGTLAPGASWTHILKVPTTGLMPRTHAVSLTATWAGAAETSLSSTSFRVGDTSVPVITSANLSDGMFVREEVLVSLQVVDDHSGVANVSALVDGTTTVALALVPGTTPLNGTWRARIPLGSEGPHLLRFTAVDKDGNDGGSKPEPRNPRSFTVVRDTQRPGIDISGVEHGGFYASVVSPVVVVSDTNLSGAVITLDGVPFVPGTSVGTDGPHRLRVEAHDKAGNSSSESIDFVVDRNKPVISVMGVSDGAVLAGPVTPVVEVVDSHLATKSILLDGLEWVPGTAVVAQGSHGLVVEAADHAGNSSSVSVSFIIDDEPPSIAITGVVNGGSYKDAVTPVVTISDMNLVSSSVKLDGVDFVSGSQVRGDGSHLLVAEASDAAGHHRRVEVSFFVDRFSIQVEKRPFSSYQALALVGSGRCVPPQSEANRLSDYLSTELRKSGGTLQVTSTEADFRGALRSGRFDLIILVFPRAYESGCAPNTPQPKVCQWVTEWVHSGNAGLVAINPSSFQMLNSCREVLGLYGSNASVLSSRAVVGWEGPLGSQDVLEASSSEQAMVLQPEAGGATPAAWYGTARGAEVAVATHTFGNGRIVSFGFDPSLATPSTGASTAFHSALSWVHPTPAELLPLGAVQMELDVRVSSSVTSPLDIRVREQLAPQLSVIKTEPLAPSLEWTYSLNGGERSMPYYFVRLPDAVGQYETTTWAEVLLPEGPWRIGSRTRYLTVGKTGEDLFSEARDIVETLPSQGPDGVHRTTIENLLNQVQTRPVATAADAEANLRDLYQAAMVTTGLSTVSPVQTRLALDRLIIYWEARWSAL
ncbi:CARDB domain-containing protein [Archangium lipolyticum]|uniref:CARDB domain-containing protein n=1 Tax=Archangium lipolyticum TaxID=2970465 RepID=UPI002149F33B|nr:CARDB domain-containing protein [Archangium lipolyticum]